MNKGGRPRVKVDVKRVRQLRAEGLSWAQIERAAGISATTARRAYFRFAKPRQNQHVRSHRTEKARPGRYWDYLQRQFGITPEGYAKILQAQNGRCAICKLLPADTATGRLLLDHCHATSRQRGLLCHNCNVAIGLMVDNPGLLRRAAEYVEAARGSGGLP